MIETQDSPRHQPAPLAPCARALQQTGRGLRRVLAMTGVLATALIAACGGGESPGTAPSGGIVTKSAGSGVPYYYVRVVNPPTLPDGVERSQWAGYDYMGADSINAGGQLALTYYNSFGHTGESYPVFIDSDGTVTRLSDGQGVARAISDAGLVVGSLVAGGTESPFAWSLATRAFRPTTLPLGVSRSYAESVSETGLVAGHYDVAGGCTDQSFRWFDGGQPTPTACGAYSRIRDLSGDDALVGDWGIMDRTGAVTDYASSVMLPPGYVAARGRYLRPGGKIFGYLTKSVVSGPFSARPVIVDGSGMRYLDGTVPNDTYDYSSVEHVSKSGVWAVGLQFGPASADGWAWSASGGKTLLRLGDQPVSPVAVNDAGIAVGHRVVGSTSYAGAAWGASTGTVDLNSRLVDAPEGLTIGFIRWIGNGGHILADSSVGLVVLEPTNRGTPPSPQPLPSGITAPAQAAVNAPVDFSVRFTDPNATDTHTATWTWGDGMSAPGTVDRAVVNDRVKGQVTGSHAFTTPGIYTVRVDIIDSTGRSGTVGRQIVVYDPNAGYVMGAGTIVSPAGAYVPDPALSGPASFAILSKYDKGANTPNGHTQFLFQAAKLAFRSDAYEWMTVSGGRRADYRGTGSLNGVPGHGFVLTAIDGDRFSTAGTPDRFRIRIWAPGGGLVYDNQGGGNDDPSDGSGTAIASGSIQIRK